MGGQPHARNISVAHYIVYGRKGTRPRQEIKDRFETRSYSSDKTFRQSWATFFH